MHSKAGIAEQTNTNKQCDDDMTYLRVGHDVGVFALGGRRQVRARRLRQQVGHFGTGGAL